ncbi:MAG: hypothetical protein K0R46_3104 [Herbinix sp.]|jgi:hypothetical protein|nr:hypothetical protein [Herbinix sp.]
MSALDKKQKRKNTVNSRLIMSLLLGLGFLSAILLVTMYATGGNSGHNSIIIGDQQEEEQEAAPEVRKGNEILGVITAIKEGTQEITLYDVIKEESVTYPYNGGTNIVDKYGQVMAVSQLPIGIMVEAILPENETKISELKVSTKAWEYVGVSNLGIDRSSRVMKIATNKYKYTDDIIILDEDAFITVHELAEMDELIIRGYEETIWSITVSRGHGTVKLMEYEGFLGDNITIGYESMQQVAEDMVIKVREGNFNLTVENAKYTATKNITVYRNQETLVTLSDLGPDAAKQGLVTFEITPFGADLFIDGRLTTYSGALELTYGDHDVVVSLEEYTTFEGNLTVDSAGKTIHIDLPEESSNEEASVTEAETDTDSIDSEDTDPNNDSETINGSENEDPEDVPDNTSNEDYEEDADHLIHVQNPIGASIYLNGEFQGVSPASFGKLIGTHVLTFIKEGYETTSYTVEVSDDNRDTYFNMPDLTKK